MTKEDLRLEFEHLSNDSHFTTKKDKADRGHKFERFLYHLLNACFLSPRTAFRPIGEEIDGSFVYGSRVFLLELKWQGNPMAASSVYTFKGKVDGKLVGTIGVFISMSGFSPDCVEAISQGKVLNVILVDGEDLRFCLEDDMLGFEGMLGIKLRKAVEYGTVYYPMSNESKSSVKKDVGSVSGNKLRGVIIIGESAIDQVVFQFLANKILKKADLRRDLVFRTAGATSSIARFANAIYAFRNVVIEGEEKVEFDFSNAKMILVTDADMDESGVKERLIADLDPHVPADIIVIDPELEVWFREFDIWNRNDMVSYAKRNHISRLEATLRNLDAINIDFLYKTEPSFKAFFDALLQP